jgi:hypothetical protein
LAGGSPGISICDAGSGPGLVGSTGIGSTVILRATAGGGGCGAAWPPLAATAHSPNTATSTTTALAAITSTRRLRWPALGSNVSSRALVPSSIGSICSSASVGGDIVSNAGDGFTTGLGWVPRLRTTGLGPVRGRCTPGGVASRRRGTRPVASGDWTGSSATANDTVEIVWVWNCSWKSDRCALATRSWSSRCAAISSANRSRMYAPSWSVEIVGLTATRHCWIASRSSAADW